MRASSLRLAAVVLAFALQLATAGHGHERLLPGAYPDGGIDPSWTAGVERWAWVDGCTLPGPGRCFLGATSGAAKRTEVTLASIFGRQLGEDEALLSAGEWFGGSGSGSQAGTYGLSVWLLAPNGTALEERRASAAVDGRAPPRLAFLSLQTPARRGMGVRVEHRSEPAGGSGWGPALAGTFVALHASPAAARAAAASLRRHAARRRALLFANETGNATATPSPSPAPLDAPSPSPSPTAGPAPPLRALNCSGNRTGDNCTAAFNNATATATPSPAPAPPPAPTPLWLRLPDKRQDARLRLETVGPNRGIPTIDAAAAGLAAALQVPAAGAEVPEAVRLYSDTFLRLRAYDIVSPDGQAVLCVGRLQAWVPALAALPLANRFFLDFRVLEAALIGPDEPLVPPANLTASPAATNSTSPALGVPVPVLVGAVVGSCLGTALLAGCFFCVRSLRRRARVFASRRATFVGLEKPARRAAA